MRHYQTFSHAKNPWQALLYYCFCMRINIENRPDHAMMRKLFVHFDKIKYSIRL